MIWPLSRLHLISAKETIQATKTPFFFVSIAYVDSDSLYFIPLHCMELSVIFHFMLHICM